MQNNIKGLKLTVAVIAIAVALLFCACEREIVDAGSNDIKGRETLFAPAETTGEASPEQTTDDKAETTSAPTVETTAPKVETTAPETETEAPETTEAEETEDPVFTGGFSGLY